MLYFHVTFNRVQQEAVGVKNQRELLWFLKSGDMDPWGVRKSIKISARCCHFKGLCNIQFSLTGKEKTRGRLPFHDYTPPPSIQDVEFRNLRLKMDNDHDIMFFMWWRETESQIVDITVVQRPIACENCQNSHDSSSSSFIHHLEPQSIKMPEIVKSDEGFIHTKIQNAKMELSGVYSKIMKILGDIYH